MITQFKASYIVNYAYDNYHSRDMPAFFLEPYSEDDFALIFLHRHSKIIVWSQESFKMAIDLKLIKKLNNVERNNLDKNNLQKNNTYHVAYSNSVSELLEQHKIDHFLLNDFLSVFYTSPNRNAIQMTEKPNDTIFIQIDKKDRYHDLYIKIIKHNPDKKFIINKKLENDDPVFFKKISNISNVEAIYLISPSIDLSESCFLVLDLNHQITDEIYPLGIRNINTISNEGTPFSLEWTDLTSLNHIINSEYERVNKRSDTDKNIIDTQLVKQSNELYLDLDFYQFPFQKNYNVNVVYLAPQLYKINHANPKYATPGIYQEHHLSTNQIYLIKAKGYQNGMEDGQVKLWIARYDYYTEIYKKLGQKQVSKPRKETIFFSPEYSLPRIYRENSSIQYLFTCQEEGTYLIGLLFDKASQETDSFVFQSLEVISIN